MSSKLAQVYTDPEEQAIYELAKASLSNTLELCGQHRAVYAQVVAEFKRSLPIINTQLAQIFPDCRVLAEPNANGVVEVRLGYRDRTRDRTLSIGTITFRNSQPVFRDARFTDNPQPLRANQVLEAEGSVVKAVLEALVECLRGMYDPCSWI